MPGKRKATEELVQHQSAKDRYETIAYPGYASSLSRKTNNVEQINEVGMPARAALNIIKNYSVLDNKAALNTSSYVNVIFEPEEEEVVKMGMRINLADQTVYPESYKMHDQCVDQIAHMWHCPRNEEEYKAYGVHAGAGTVGSTEACLLGALALKFRWRSWYKKKHGLTETQVRGVMPNIVMSTLYQACWEKVFKYLDIEPKLISPSVNTFTIEPKDVIEAIDDKTIGVVCIMGNHYGGQYDPVWAIDPLVTKLNEEKGFQVGIHVDGASGGFIAPFQPEVKPWDFRLPNVLSISASGHKFGESCCGTGWVVWRQRADLSEHVAISVTYLGGKADSYTLNFSRPASGVYVQFYKFLRLGMEGYQNKVDNAMFHSKELRDALKAMKHEGKPRFVMLDTGDDNCLPVVTARLNPELGLAYNDIDLQHIISEDHWYVSGYKMMFNHPIEENPLPLFCDQCKDTAMFRVVVKSNLTTELISNLISVIHNAIAWLDKHYVKDTHKTTINKPKMRRALSHHSSAC